MMASKEKKMNVLTADMINYLHKNYISLQEKDMKIYVNHFRKVLGKIVDLMKKVDPLFETSFREICGAGSYFDGLKVGKPQEFDMDVIIKLPVNVEQITIVNEDVVPAFTKIEMKKPLQLLRQHPKWTAVYRHMDSWVDEQTGFLLQTEFKQWFESVVVKALNTMVPIKPNLYELKIPDPADNTETSYKISLRKSGPAMTFFITIPPDDVQIDVDFVPVIEFCHPQWPPLPVRRLPESLVKAKKTKWFIVPKPKKNNPDGTIWRLAFHEQERELIHNKGILKPVCRLLKKFRDQTGLNNIASYYLKTLFLWEIEDQNEEFCKKTRQLDMFLDMLEKLSLRLKEGSIPYYWDSRYNLLEGLETDNKINIMCRLAKIIADIRKKSLTEPYIMAKYLVPKDEYEIVKKKFEIPALDLTPAKPVLVKKDSKVSSSIQIPVANKQVEASSSDCAALTGAVSQEKTCTNCTVKIELMMEVLQKLLVKVNGLEKSLQVLQTQNENLKDQFLVKVNGLEKIMEAVQNENENLKDRICLINAQNENILNLH